MAKKIILGVLLFGLIGVLVAGGIIRTLDKTGDVALAQGFGQERGATAEHDAEDACTEEGEYAGGGQYGRGGDTDAGKGAEDSEYAGGRGREDAPGQRAQASEERQYLNNETLPEAWLEIEGTVAQAPAAGVDMIVVTEAGEEVMVGTGPGYMEAQGFVLQEGETVRMQGFWENDEFKAAQVTRLRDGATIVLRDQSGRPAWAGSGRNSNSAGGNARGSETAPRVEI